MTGVQTCALPISQLEANLAALRVELTPEDLEELGTLAEPAERYWRERADLSWS